MGLAAKKRETARKCNAVALEIRTKERNKNPKAWQSGLQGPKIKLSKIK